MIYNLNYELKTPDKDYTGLFNYLEHELGESRIHVLRDCWWIASKEELDIDETCDKIHEFIGEKDHFHFSLLTNAQINGWLPSSNWEWYNENK